MERNDYNDESVETESDLDDVKRRELLAKAAKLSVYSKPTVTVMLLSSSTHVQGGLGSPPLPPGAARGFQIKKDARPPEDQSDN